MNEILYELMRRAEYTYTQYLSACDNLAKEAQKHIDWNDSVSCEYYPGDGVCVGIGTHVCPVMRFFLLAEQSCDGMIDEYTYRTNCI